MRIGFDGKRATNNLTGLGNYSRWLIHCMATQYINNQYFIYTPKTKKKLLTQSVFALKNIRLKLPSVSKFLWRSLGIKKQLQQDEVTLYHGLSQEIPFGIQKTNIKSIVTIHDLIYLKRPSEYSFINRNIYRFKSKYACKNADKIIAISETTKSDIVELYRINPDKIEVIYQSCDELFKIPASEQQKQNIVNKYKLPKEFLLNVGRIVPHKNQLLIIKALQKLNKKTPLVIVGKKSKYTQILLKTIQHLGLEESVILLNDVPNADLPIIYQCATIFVFPSFYEGFGIPIIEALYSGTPVIAATGSCLEEAGGPNSVYVSPTDHAELAKKIDTLLENENLRKEMAVKGLAYVQKFNNDVLTKQLMDCYQKTLSQ